VIHIDLFSGIGGFALAAEAVWPDIEHIFCDNEPFAQQVLRKHWPNSPIYGDIRTLTNTSSTRLDAEHTSQAQTIQSAKWTYEKENTIGGCGLESSPDNKYFILTGGFPCQPFSHAGRRKGTEDDRYLWPEMFRVIREFAPLWVIAENVRGLATWNDGMVFEQVCADLESEGYEVQSFIVPAVAVNAPHRRDRIWFIAFNPEHAGQHGSQDGQSGTSGSDGDKAGAYQDEQSTRSDSPRNNAPNARPQRRFEGAEGVQSSRQEPERTDNGIGGCFPDWNRDWREVAFATCHDRVDDGLSKRVVRLPDGSTISRSKWRQQALKAYGNAIVPAVAVEIMKAIALSKNRKEEE